MPTTLSPAVAQRLAIAADHQRLGPSPVRLNHVPNWFRRRLLAAYGCDRGIASGWYVLRHALRCQGDSGGWLDHWGSTLLDGRVCFVAEPYDLSPRDLASIAAIAERCGCEWSTSDNSWWYPGRTVRVVFREPPAG